MDHPEFRSQDFLNFLVKKITQNHKNMKHLITFLLLAAVVSCNKNTEHQNPKPQTMNTENTALFAKGDPVPTEWFTGKAFLTPMISKDKNNEYSIGSVWFEKMHVPTGTPIPKDRY